MTSDRITEKTFPVAEKQCLPEHVRSVHGPEGATVLDILRGGMFRLNFAASRIFELLKQGLEGPEITEQLACEFGIERLRAEEDVREFLETLHKHHLLISRINYPVA